MKKIRCTGPYFAVATASFAFVSFIAFIAAARAQDVAEGAKKHPVPKAAELEKASKDVGAVFDFAAARAEADKLKLAGEIMQVAVDSGKNPPAQYVMFQRAMEIATGLGNRALAERVVGEIESRFDVDVLAIRADNLQQMLKAPIPIAEKRFLLQSCVELVDAAMAADRFELAAQLADDFNAIARRAREAELIKALGERRRDASIRAREFKQVEAALTTLKSDPTDQAANLVAGKYYCFTKNDWAHGMPMLVLCGEASLAALATHDLKGAATWQDQSALADAWWELGEKNRGAERDAFRARGGFWYKRALASGITGLNRIRAEKRYEEVTKLVDAMSAAGSRSATARSEPQGLSNGLILHYKLDEVEDNGQVTDASGRGNHGRIAGRPRVTQDGKVGGAIEFQRGDYINTPSLGTHEKFTIAMWVRHVHQPDQKRTSLIHNNGNWGAQVLHAHIASWGVVTFGIGGTKNPLQNNFADVSTKSHPKPDVWNHYVMVYDATESKGMIYLNGQRDVETTYDAVTSAKIGPAQIGAWNGHFRLFAGAMDDVRIYNRPLSADEAAALFKLGGH
jgi:hypothetical protein